MKKLIVLLLLVVPLFAGCANIETRLTLNKDNSVQVASSLTYKGNLADKGDNNAKMITDSFLNYLDESYKIDKAFGDKFSTIAATKKVFSVFDSDVDLSSFGFRTNLPSGRFVDVHKNFLATSYNVNLVFDYPKLKKVVEENSKKAEEEASNAMTPEYLEKYADPEEVNLQDQGKADFEANLDQDAMVLKDEKEIDKGDLPINPKNNKPSVDDKLDLAFSIELPYFAYYNNADSSDGNIYTWKIKETMPTVIKLQYVQYSAFAVWLIIVLGVGFLIYLARRIIKHENQKRIGTNN